MVTEEISEDNFGLGIRQDFTFEFDLKNKPQHHALRQKLGGIFCETTMYQWSWWPYKDYPIALITFLYSLFLAANPEYRAQFLATYIGKIPKITCDLFKTMKIGQFENDQFLNGFRFSHPNYTFMQNTLFFDYSAFNHLGLANLESKNDKSYIFGKTTG